MTGALIIVAGLCLALLGSVLVSAFHEITTYVGGMSRRQLLGSLALMLVGGLLLWLYLRGDFAYALWLDRIQLRPADELVFARAAANFKKASELDLHRSTWNDRCREYTSRLEQLSSSVAGWSGTVEQTYLIGTHLAISVRVGRHVILRTAYNIDDTESLISNVVPMFARVQDLQPGDPVIIDGTSAKDQVCAFRPGDSDIVPDAEVLFRFTNIRPN